jgi:hypothetical protein
MKYFRNIKLRSFNIGLYPGPHPLNFYPEFIPSNLQSNGILKAADEAVLTKVLKTLLAFLGLDLGK